MRFDKLARNQKSPVFVIPTPRLHRDRSSGNDKKWLVIGFYELSSFVYFEIGSVLKFQYSNLLAAEGLQW